MAAYGENLMATHSSRSKLGVRAGSHPPKLSGAAPLNRASRATIAFLKSDRPDAPRAGDAFGDRVIVRVLGVG
jgi:hypothetical protein